eukprot:TRINITY_DN1051_c1_g1_i4.p1 TRINITY_DN1051_c1_g1~~TRINITY_DN1051_c1_g1_i4.p1  ORF type:complete len:378 (+),score=66.54 TRINITY_DN1051_c1_g1_i4:189-1322(+)
MSYNSNIQITSNHMKGVQSSELVQKMNNTALLTDTLVKLQETTTSIFEFQQYVAKFFTEQDVEFIFGILVELKKNVHTKLNPKTVLSDTHVLLQDLRLVSGLIKTLCAQILDMKFVNLVTKISETLKDHDLKDFNIPQDKITFLSDLISSPLPLMVTFVNVLIDICNNPNDSSLTPEFIKQLPQVKQELTKFNIDQLLFSDSQLRLHLINSNIVFSKPLEFDLVEPSRTYIYHSAVYKIISGFNEMSNISSNFRSSNTSKKLVLILFNDILLCAITKKKREKFNVKDYYYLSDITVKEVRPKTDDQFCMEVDIPSSTSTSSSIHFVVCFENQFIYSNWVNNLKSLIPERFYSIDMNGEQEICYIYQLFLTSKKACGN